MEYNLRQDGNYFLITPLEAARMLQRNTHNRSLVPTQVAFLVNEIASGRWMRNGATILFSKEGELMDGQHRLSAIVKAGIPAWCKIDYTIDKAAFPTIDTGRRRTPGDVLHIAGEKSGIATAAALSWVARYESGMNIRFYKNTASQMPDLIARHPGIRDSVSAIGHKCAGMMAPSILTAFHYIASKVDAELSQEFCLRLHDGVELKEGSAVKVLRDKLQNNARSKARLPPIHIFAALNKAWPYFKIGRNITAAKLRWSTDEEFPKIE